MLEVDELGVAIFRKVGTIVRVKERANMMGGQKVGSDDAGSGD
jgi:hypothetical protein